MAENYEVCNFYLFLQVNARINDKKHFLRMLFGRLLYTLTPVEEPRFSVLLQFHCRNCSMEQLYITKKLTLVNFTAATMILVSINI